MQDDDGDVSGEGSDGGLAGGRAGECMPSMKCSLACL